MAQTRNLKRQTVRERPAQQRRRYLRLTALPGSGSGPTEVVVPPDRVLIGRGPSVQLQLRDPLVSVEHVELDWRSDGILLNDRCSTNGTWIDSIRVERATVPLGTRLRLGTTTVVLGDGGEDAPPPEEADAFDEIVGQSVAMRQLYARLAKAAHSELPVLLLGPSGSGKELAARSLYKQGRRANAPFVVCNCPLLRPDLAPSVLFGHERGAFTGAVKAHVGLFSQAHGGVLFLDEVAELHPDVQAMLLRALETGQVQPVGSAQAPVKVDIQIIAATKEDLAARVSQGLFREDLYWRLAALRVRLPPLEERREDIPLLVVHALRDVPASGAREIAPAAMVMLSQRSYPGQVRELRNLVRQLSIFADGPAITAEMVRQEVGPDACPPTNGGATDYHVAKATSLEQFHREYLPWLLQQAEGKLSRAAEMGNIQKHNLRALLVRYGLWGDKDGAEVAKG